MICISGWAGTGKDECSGRLVKVHRAFHTGLADPGKRHGLDAYGFTEEQLWGPSKYRNAGDSRYPKPVLKEFGFRNDGVGTWSSTVDRSNRDEMFLKGKSWMGPQLAFMHAAMRSDTEGPQTVTVQDTDPAWFLSPREFLQLYMELCNTLYADTWIDKGIADHRRLATGDYTYSRMSGTTKGSTFENRKQWASLSSDEEYVDSSMIVTCFSDFRHVHEHRKAKAAADSQLVPVLVRIKRTTVPNPPFKHRSETEQTRIRDAAYDFVIDNSGYLEDLYGRVDDIVRQCSDSSWAGKTWSEEFILPTESETYQP